MEDNYPKDEIRYRIIEAEKRMVHSFYKDLFSDSAPPLTEEQKARLNRQARIRKVLAPYYFIKWRIIGIWNVILYGDSDPGRIEDDY